MLGFTIDSHKWFELFKQEQKINQLKVQSAKTAQRIVVV